MKKLVYLFIFCITFTSINVTFGQGQKAKLVFDNMVHDFGKIKENGGRVTHKFSFTNTGAEPMKISNVKTSCGCTTPDWSREVIPAGGKGLVSVAFDPKRRPGEFNKSVTVQSNAENSNVVLRIKGYVEKKEQTIDQKYRYEMGSIRLKQKSLHLTEIYKSADKKVSKGFTSLIDNFLNNSKNTKIIEILNIATEPVKITLDEKRKTPKTIKAKVIPETLEPNQTGKIYISYLPNETDSWGYVYNRVNLTINNKSNYSNRITVSATIKEEFSKFQEENPPGIEFINGKEFKFGKIKQGEKVEHNYKFKNTGKSDLIIRNVKASCGCTATSPKDKVIKPGQESNIKTIFNSSGKKGKQNKSITVITNIPGKNKQGDNSRIILRITGEVIVN